MPRYTLYYGTPGQERDTQPLREGATEETALRLAKSYARDGYCVELWALESPGVPARIWSYDPQEARASRAALLTGNPT